MHWFQKAAQQGHARAQFNLAMMYARGEGVARNDALAFEWMQKAANQLPEARQYLDRTRKE
ncbi:hypothetical protein [Sinorhizobium medicae]|uniref:hypothetical protein n=1 Tax=Sinorhizobium medicae TaxID=110321 RepID=UPI003C781BF8